MKSVNYFHFYGSFGNLRLFLRKNVIFFHFFAQSTTKKLFKKTLKKYFTFFYLCCRIYSEITHHFPPYHKVTSFGASRRALSFIPILNNHFERLPFFGEAFPVFSRRFISFPVRSPRSPRRRPFFSRRHLPSARLSILAQPLS